MGPSREDGTFYLGAGLSGESGFRGISPINGDDMKFAATASH